MVKTSSPMIHSLKTLFSLDTGNVTLTNRIEVFYWTERFGVSEQRLRLAIKCVGTDPVYLQMYFF